MNQRLADFLIDLAENADVRAAFERDPAGTMAQAGLSAAEQAAVRSRDQRQIRLLLSRAPASGLRISPRRSGTRSPAPTAFSTNCRRSSPAASSR